MMVTYGYCLHETAIFGTHEVITDPKKGSYQYEDQVLLVAPFSHFWPCVSQLTRDVLREICLSGDEISAA